MKENQRTYNYSFPEQKRYRAYLFENDAEKIAEKADCAKITVNKMLQGTRKMQSYVRVAIEEVIEENTEFLQNFKP